jgi:type I restriction enzyme S subunit
VEAKKVNEERYIKVGDVLVNSTGTGTLGRVAQVRTTPSEPTTVDTHVTIVRPLTGLFYDDFFGYMLIKIEEEITSAGEGASGQTELARSKLKNEFSVSYSSSLVEQKRIVAILDQTFADIEQARAKTEQNLKNARELFESYLQQMFSQRGEVWNAQPLGSVCKFQNGFAFKSKDTVANSDTQLIRMGNLYQNILDLNRKPAFYPDEFAEEYSRYKLKSGDLVISLTGTVGKEDYGFTVEIPFSKRTLLLNQRIAKIIDIDSKQIEKPFLLRILRSRWFLEELYSTANGTRQANLSTTTMSGMIICFPSVKKQKLICEKLGALERQVQNIIKIYSEKLVCLDELKKSILQKAFTGELTGTNHQTSKEYAA